MITELSPFSPIPRLLQLHMLQCTSKKCRGLSLGTATIVVREANRMATETIKKINLSNRHDILVDGLMEILEIALRPT